MIGPDLPQRIVVLPPMRIDTFAGPIASVRERLQPGVYWVPQNHVFKMGVPPRHIRFWMIAIVLSSYPGYRFVHERLVGARRRRNHCLACDYNLTGNVSGVCPECGTPIEEAPAP